MKPIKFEVIGEPVPQGSMIAVSRRDDTNRPPFMRPSNQAKLRPWRKEIGEAALLASQDAVCPKAEALYVVVEFVCTRPAKPKYEFPITGDIDKLVRAVLDGMTGVIFEDDTQVVGVSAAKRYAAYGEPARAVVTVSPANEGSAA